MNHLLYMAILLFGGLLFSRLLGYLKFPKVTGYLIGGIIIGPSVLGLISKEEIQLMEVITQVALSFIAFSIGNQMKISQLKRQGSGILLITVCEAMGAFLLVAAGSYFIFHTSGAFAITLGSIACATAPAATLMVIKQYHAQGELVDVLIPVVALDDAVGIIVFGVCSSIAAALLKGESIQVFQMIMDPLIEIFLAVAIGFAAGIITVFLTRKAENDDELITLMIAIIFLVTFIAEYLGLSSLLILMVTGIILANVHNANRRYQQLIDKITPPIFVLFFVLSGADLDLQSLTKVGAVGVFYIFARVIGKMAGAFLSSKAAGYSKNVQKYLGFTLMPQAGVAIGLSLIASKMIPEPNGSLIRTIILGATILYELVGPITAKFALKGSGAIKES